jgi:hypothetical protein
MRRASDSPVLVQSPSCDPSPVSVPCVPSGTAVAGSTTGIIGAGRFVAALVGGSVMLG